MIEEEVNAENELVFGMLIDARKMSSIAASPKDSQGLSDFSLQIDCVKPVARVAGVVSHSSSFTGLGKSISD